MRLISLIFALHIFVVKAIFPHAQEFQESLMDQTSAPSPVAEPRLAPTSQKATKKVVVSGEANRAQAQSSGTINPAGNGPCPCQQANAAGPPIDAKSKPDKPSFSELTLFFFASGLALFVALLAWSDAIRGIDRDTKELEKRFLESTGVNKRDFLSVVKTEKPDEQLDALTRVMTSGRIKSEGAVQLLGTFRSWNKEWSVLEAVTSWKYNLTVALTLTLLVAGIASLFTTPIQIVKFHFFSIRSELFILTFPLVLIFSLMGMIIYSGRKERALRILLNSIADKV